VRKNSTRGGSGRVTKEKIRKEWGCHSEKTAGLFRKIAMQKKKVPGRRICRKGRGGLAKPKTFGEGCRNPHKGKRLPKEGEERGKHKARKGGKTP